MTESVLALQGATGSLIFHSVHADTTKVLHSPRRAPTDATRKMSLKLPTTLRSPVRLLLAMTRLDSGSIAPHQPRFCTTT